MQNIGKSTLTYTTRPFSDSVATLVAGAAGEQHFNVPGTLGSLTTGTNPANAGTVCRITTTVAIYILNNGQTAAAPVTSTSFPNPNTNGELFTPFDEVYVNVTPGQLFSVYFSAAGNATFSFYRDTDLLDFQSSPLTGP